MLRHILFSIALTAAASTAAAQPPALHAFQDWVVGCDNTLGCTAVSLQSVDSGDGDATMIVRREAGADAQPEVTFRIDFRMAGPLRRATGLLLDGFRARRALSDDGDRVSFLDRRFGGLHFIAIARDLDSFSLIDDQEEVIASASLKGLKAALDHMDEAQGRADGPTALVRRLERINPPPPTEPPATPLIQRPPAGGAPVRTLTDEEIAFQQGVHGPSCRAPRRPAGYRPKVEYHRLDGATTLAIIEPSCFEGAYNVFRIALLIANSGEVRRPEFEFALDGDTPHLVVNPWWDANGRILGTHAKGRGIGDCGIAQKYAWDGERFRLAAQKEMSPCRGSFEMIRTWRADVRDR